MVSFVQKISAWLMFRPFLLLVFLINLGGTIYGYIWYGWQLKITEPKFLIFVPDSPTASLFFTIVLGLWLIGKRSSIFEALAFVTLIKYGLWAVVMNLLTLAETGSIGWMGWMLVVSHFAMAMQAVLYIDHYRFGWLAAAATAVWTLHNDVIDYVFGQMPIYGSLDAYTAQIGYFTFWLSIACIAFSYVVVHMNKPHGVSVDHS
ncbi:putative membrane protein YpjA [Planomicrobium sp. HSC-17F08]|nr:putative membrane protein YpjA [Planomicrobium sp. HSC-17F08]